MLPARTERKDVSEKRNILIFRTRLPFSGCVLMAATVATDNLPVGWVFGWV